MITGHAMTEEDRGALADRSPARMNDVDPQAWLADVLARLPDHPANKIADLLPWNWKANQQCKAALPPERFAADHRACLGRWPDAYGLTCWFPSSFFA
jgi:IS66 C-terminal element